MGTGLPHPDDLLPVVHFREYHERVVDAPVETVRRALLGLHTRQVRLLGPLTAVRTLPARLSRRADRTGPSDSLLFDTLARGFEILARDRDGYVFVAVGQPHRIRPSGSWTVGSAEAFAEFDEPGYCKIAADFRVREHAGRVVVSTETVVGCTDRATRRAFARYWLVIRPFSGLIRRSMLAAVRRAAARDSSTGRYPGQPTPTSASSRRPVSSREPAP